jgi:hypothetical protein
MTIHREAMDEALGFGLDIIIEITIEIKCNYFLLD